MCKCKTPGCKECGDQSATYAQLANKVAELETALDTVISATKFLTCGHPILMIDKESDIQMFDADGLGTSCWEGWAFCNGQTFTTADGNFTTTNLLNKFVVGAGDDYEVGDTGGANTVTLTEDQMPTHAHTVNDPGHDHTVTDNGHNHGTSQSPHSHGVTDPGHDHTASSSIEFTPSSVQYSYIQTTADVTGDGGTSVPDTWDQNSLSATVNTTVSESNTGIEVDNASISITVQNSNTGVAVNTSNTGIELDPAGNSEAHENRPPYYAVIFVQKL